MGKIYKDNEFMEYPKEKRVYNLSVQAISIEWIKKFRNQFEPGDDDYNLIDGLLNIWRKENEHKESD